MNSRRTNTVNRIQSTIIRQRRGSLGLAVIALSLAGLVILPLSTGLIRLLDSQRLLLAAGAYLDETLPQTYFCLVPESLAEGRLEADPALVDAFVRNRIAANLPETLSDRLTVDSVELDWLAVPADDAHWLGGDQPEELPWVRCTVTIRPVFGQSLHLTRSVELYQVAQ